MKKHSLLFFFLFLFLSLSSQTGREPEEEENQKKRQEWFAKRKADPSVSNPEKARWEAYQQSQHKSMESSGTAVAGWESLGPNNQGGRVISHAFDPIDIQTLWVGSASGGLWKTSDGGGTWSAMTDQIPNLAIGAVAIQPDNPDIMLIGTGEGYLLSAFFQYGIGVLRSTDGGVTWGPTDLTVPDSLYFACLGFAWDPINTDNVYLATTYGIFRSADAGSTWVLSLAGVGTSIVINKKFPANIYVSLQDYSGSPGGIHHSTDYGATWTQLTSGLPPSTDIGFTHLSICDSFPNILYAGISAPAAAADCGVSRGLFKTSDGGLSWQPVPTGGVDFYCYPPPYDYLCLGWYDNVLQVAPDDSNDIFIGGVYLYHTTDGGASWNYSDTAPFESPAWMHPDHHDLGISPHNPSVLYSFNDGGVFKSTNGGLTWIKKPNGIVTTQFYYIASSPPDKNLMMGGTQDNGVFVNPDINTSLNWSQTIPGDGFSCIMDPTDADTWYTSELFNGRLKTTDSGASYDTIQTGITDATYFLISMVMDPNDNQVLYTGTDVNIYKTTDGGANWNALSNKPYISTIAIDRLNSDVLYICNDPLISVSYIYRSTDAGVNWTYLGGPGNKITDIETDPHVSGTLYASRGTYTAGTQVYKSTDSGASWTNISSDLPAIPVNTLALDAFNSDHIYAGTDLGVYLTTDGGASWNSFNDDLPLVIVQDMHFYEGDSTVRIGTHGRGVWKTKSAMSVAVHEATVHEVDLSAFPNPASSEVTISYSLPTPGNTSTSVYNSSGQKIILLSETDETPGKHSLKWNLKNAAGERVASGVYYVRIVHKGVGYTCKVLVE